MGRLARQGAFVTVGAVAIVLAMFAPAWACIVLGTNAFLSFPTTAGPVGSVVRIHGEGWANAPMRFTWDGAALALPIPVDGPDFTVSVTVPSGAVGSYHMLGADQPAAQDANLRRGTGHTFEVTNPDGSVPNRAATSSTGATSLLVTGNPTASGGTPPAPSGGQAYSPVVIPGPVTTEGPGTSATATAPSRAASSSQAAAVTSEGPGSVTGSVRAPGATGAAATADTSANPNTTPAAVGATPFPTLSPRSATGELWTGFGSRSGLPAPGLGSLPATSGGPSQAAMGFGILAVGSVALLGGFGVAELRRRRALAAVRYDD